jgi:hypothetical protein
MWTAIKKGSLSSTGSAHPWINELAITVSQTVYVCTDVYEYICTYRSHYV